MKKINYLKLIFYLYIFFMPLNFSLGASQFVVNKIPVEPSLQKVSKSKKSKTAKKHLKNYSQPKDRVWGIWSLATGGYLIVFALFCALFFIGSYYYLYFLAILLVLLVFGIYLTANGVSIIDRSYIHYSDHPDLKSERIRPGIIMDFVFAGLLALAILGFILLQFYLSAWLCLIAVLAMITITSLKISALKKANSDSKKEKIE